MNSNLLSGFNFTKILSGFNKTLTLANKAIPVYKQVGPIIGKARNALNIINVSKSAKDEIIKEQIMENTRPIITEKNANNNIIELDTLTFFQ